MSWLLFALLAPLFWSVSNYIDKFALGVHVKSIVDFMFFGALLSWVFVPFLILIFGLPDLSWSALWAVLLGVVLIFSYGLYGKALECGETSTLMPLTGLIPVFTIAIEVFFLNRVFEIHELLAAAIIIAGASMLVLEPGSSWRQFFKPGTWWMVVACVVWGAMFVGFDLVLLEMDFGDYIVWDVVGNGLAALILLVFPWTHKHCMDGILSAKRSKYGWFALNNVMDLLGQMSIKKALSLAPAAGLVTVVMQIQSVYLLILGVVLTLVIPQLIKEDIAHKHIMRKFIAIMVIIGGVGLLTL